MQLTNRLISIVSNITVIIGITLGIFGLVRAGSLFVAVGVASIALKARGSLKFDFYFPLAMAIALFTLALALPHGG